MKLRVNESRAGVALLSTFERAWLSVDPEGCPAGQLVLGAGSSAYLLALPMTICSSESARRVS